MATIRERLLSAGLDPERVETHLRDGWVRVDGEPTNDGDLTTSGPIVIWPPASQP